MHKAVKRKSIFKSNRSTSCGMEGISVTEDIRRRAASAAEEFEIISLEDVWLNTKLKRHFWASEMAV